MSKLAPRQLYFFLACIAPVGKIVLLPTQLVESAKNDLLFPALFHLLLQAGIIFCIMLLSRNEKPLFELLENTFGRVCARIFYALFGLFMLYASLFPLIEQKLLVQSVFYDTLPSFLTFIPFFVFGAYVCTKPFLHHGRVWDLLAPLTLFGFLGIFVFSFGNADFSALLPVGASGAKGMFTAFKNSSLFFYDSALVLLFMGRFKYEKGMAVKSCIFYLLGGAIVLLFLAIFYGVFSDIAIRQTFAFSKVSKYFSASSVLGRIDYVFICLLSLTMAFYALLPVHASAHCLYLSARKKIPAPVISVTLNLILMILLVALNFEPNSVLTLIGDTLFFLFPLFCGAIPLLCLLLRRSPREAKNS